jgi:hypothetical protein
LKNRVSVHISFAHPPSAILSPEGPVAFAIGLKLLVSSFGQVTASQP